MIFYRISWKSTNTIALMTRFRYLPHFQDDFTSLVSILSPPSSDTQWSHLSLKGLSWQHSRIVHYFALSPLIPYFLDNCVFCRSWESGVSASYTLYTVYDSSVGDIVLQQGNEENKKLMDGLITFGKPLDFFVCSLLPINLIFFFLSLSQRLIWTGVLLHSFVPWFHAYMMSSDYSKPHPHQTCCFPPDPFPTLMCFCCVFLIQWV